MTRIAGHNRPAPEVLHVDYADVLAQAVANERWRVVREVEHAANRIPVSKQSSSRGYGTDPIDATAYRSSLLAALRNISETPNG